MASYTVKIPEKAFKMLRELQALIVPESKYAQLLEYLIEKELKERKKASE